jgi:hypothetical protein
MRTNVLLVCVILVLFGCASASKSEPTVIKNIDFQYDTIWKATCAAVEARGFELKECNKDDRSITTYYKILPETNVEDPRMRSYKALVKLVPREAPTGVKYDVEIQVGLYWKFRTPLTDPQENWEFIRWDREIEEGIVAEFHNQTAIDQRVKQGHEEFKKRTGREF